MGLTEMTAAEYDAYVTRTMSERVFQRRVEELARMGNWSLYHTYDSRRSHPGFPDLVLVRGERLIFAELKTERGRTTPEQLAWLSELANVTRVETYLWRPSNRDRVTEVLQ